MTQQTSVTVKTSGALAIVAGVVTDVNGNLWDLPNPTNVGAGKVATVTATANAQNPNAPFPGSNLNLTINNPQVGWLSAATAAKLTQVEFVTMFPEFGNTTNFPPGNVNTWLDLAYKRLPAPVWQDLLDQGIALFVAHNITLERQNAKAAANGGAPGQNVGPLNSKSVDKVSAGYDTGAGTIDGGGNYNLTNYGTRFLDLVDIVGVVGDALIGLPQYGLPGTVVGG